MINLGAQIIDNHINTARQPSHTWVPSGSSLAQMLDEAALDGFDFRAYVKRPARGCLCLAADPKANRRASPTASHAATAMGSPDHA